MGFITVSKFSRKIWALRPIRHLSENQLLQPAGCPFCGEPDDRDYVTMLQKNPDVMSLRCGKCHALSASRMPTKDTLDQFYAQYYTHLGTGVTIDAPKRFAHYIYNLCGSLKDRKNIRILDFGGGNGTMAYLLAQHFLLSGTRRIHILVIDTHLQLPMAVEGPITIEVADNVESNAGVFDVVIASNVLDHIPDAVTPLRQLLSHMAEGGLFYARATYFEGLVRLANRFNLTLDLIYPEHVHDLGQFFWNGLFRNVFPDMCSDFSLVRSCPSKVETLFRVNPVRTLLAYLLKFPYYILGSRYTLVGGWEVLIRRKAM